MKKQIFLILLFLNTFSYAQINGDCDEISLCCPAGNVVDLKITPLEELDCARKDATLYEIFPKVVEYKGLLFNQINKCKNGDLGSELQFEYCISNKTYKMQVLIVDVKDPFYETVLGKAIKNSFLIHFTSGLAGSAMFKSYKSKNKKLDNSYIDMSNAEDKTPYVSYDALHKGKYYIHIVIDGKNLKNPDEVDVFIKEYIEAFTFKEK
ncbi:hypothetical protein [Pedobacter arcticus]|uniref:hypothetical protein n=1 Tax=Pedobacter arcticus TaxID=752140 RepID=UPI0003162A79|nr:hypothetical protein [Pedobacter arcticus]